MTHVLQTEIDDRGVARVTLNRPDKHNALSDQLIDALNSIAVRLGADPEVRAIILTGSGRSFCAGGDLRWMQAQMAGDRKTRTMAAEKIANMFNTLNNISKPVIGRINGHAFGGGIGLACVCDIAICTDTAQFGLTETRLGLIPATIAPYVLARMGQANARQVFMSSRVFDAARARELGLVGVVVTHDDLDAAVEKEVLPYLRCAPGAVAAAKAMVRSLGPEIDAATIRQTTSALADRWESGEAHEGLTAFFEKRPPDWEQ